MAFTGRDRRTAALTCCSLVAVAAAAGGCTPDGSGHESPPAHVPPTGATRTALPSLRPTPDAEFSLVATASGRGGERTVAFQSVPQDAAYRVTAACLGTGVLVVQLGSGGWEVVCSGEASSEIFSAPPNTKSVFVAAETGTDWELIVQRFNQR